MNTRLTQYHVNRSTNRTATQPLELASRIRGIWRSAPSGCTLKRHTAVGGVVWLRKISSRYSDNINVPRKQEGLYRTREGEVQHLTMNMYHLLMSAVERRLHQFANYRGLSSKWRTKPLPQKRTLPSQPDYAEGGKLNKLTGRNGACACLVRSTCLSWLGHFPHSPKIKDTPTTSDFSC